MAAIVLSPFPGTTMVAQRPAAIQCIKDNLSGGSSLTDDRAAMLGETASAMVESYAPDAPAAIKNEATLRIAGWLHSRRPNPLQAVTTNSMRLDLRERFYAPDAMINSGAKSLLQEYKTMRALPIEEVS